MYGGALLKFNFFDDSALFKFIEATEVALSNLRPIQLKILTIKPAGKRTQNLEL